MSLPSNFCIAPFHRFQTSTDGRCGPCSYIANVWDLSKYKTLHEKWNSPEYEKFRQSFINNEQNPLCNLCWREEKAGQTSLRHRLNTFGGAKNLNKIFKKWFYEEPKTHQAHKWYHTFDIYERHFEKYVGTNPVILEIGVEFGGGIEMLNYYFDNQCTIYGIDFNPV